MSNKKEIAVTKTAFKAFDKNMKCRDFQFEIGKTYNHDGEVKTCESGFHSCEYPLDCFSYYSPSESEYCVVEAGGKIDTHSDDSKIASASITITAKIEIPDIVTKKIEWIMARVDKTLSSDQDRGYSCATGDQSASSATGYRSASSATGYRSASSATGDRSASSATGDNSVAMNIGVYGKAKAGIGGAIVLCARDDDCKLLHIRASKVGENGIKPDTFYILDGNGEFIEADK